MRGALHAHYGRGVEHDFSDDEVDLLVDAWSRRLPDVDLAPLDVMSRLRRASLRLAQIRAAAFRTVGLAAWEFDVLAALRRSEPPHELSPAQLIESTHIGSPAMTHRLAKLVDRGYVERMPHPYDGRSIIIRLTGGGAAKADAAMTELVRREAAALAALDPGDQAVLVRLLRPLARGE